MNKFIFGILMLMISGQAFASVKACGAINGKAGELTFTQVLRGETIVPSSIYANTKLSAEKQKEINDQLASYVGFHEVCVMVSTNEANEGDTVVNKIVSYLE